MAAPLYNVASIKLFKSCYQGPGCIELFSARGNNPVKYWKLSGAPSGIRREYSKNLRGLVYCLDAGSRTVKMRMPADETMSLSINQRFLVFQVKVPEKKYFCLEIGVTDSDNIQRRLYFSTMRRQFCASSLLNAKIPFIGLQPDVWSTLFIDLYSFGSVFTTKASLTLNDVTVHANCEIRRIFTMEPQMETSKIGMFLDEKALTEMVPRSCVFPGHVTNVAQILDLQSFRKETIPEKEPEKAVS
ncbi:protein CFAP20DC-like [Synchiropus picturatus]